MRKSSTRQTSMGYVTAVNKVSFKMPREIEIGNYLIIQLSTCKEPPHIKQITMTITKTVMKQNNNELNNKKNLGKGVKHLRLKLKNTTTLQINTKYNKILKHILNAILKTCRFKVVLFFKESFQKMVIECISFECL